jgi:hypothetical protein
MTELLSRSPTGIASSDLRNPAEGREGGERPLDVAVIIPCHNEELTIGEVVESFRSALPGCTVHVCDNASTDRTAACARAAGAALCYEPLKGKGNAVRRLFADVDADVYVLVDGDGTYDAAAAQRLVLALVERRLDMVNGARESAAKEAFRFGHRFGNQLFTYLVGRLFGARFQDIFSGYRVLSRRFVKTFPAQVRGFDIETEMTVHALEMRMPVDELTASYRERPHGSVSKLSTWKDGARILWRVFMLLREERPLPFFGALFALLAASSVTLAIPLLATFLETGMVPRLPTGVLCVGLMLLAFLALGCGLVLDTVTRGRREMKRMFYLAVPAVNGAGIGGQAAALSSGDRPWAATQRSA